MSGLEELRREIEALDPADPEDLEALLAANAMLTIFELSDDASPAQKEEVARLLSRDV